MADIHVKVKMPQLPKLVGVAEQDDQLFVWDTSAGKLCKADVSQLPFGTGGGNGGLPILPATFTVTTQTVGYSTVGGASIVSDTRLIGATGYTIRTTQLNNAAFRFDEVQYDAVNGKFTIPNFVLLLDELIIVDAPGKPSGTTQGGSYDALLARITLLEQIAAPMIPSVFGARGGMLLWRKPANEIPAGWQEVIDYRGKTVIGQDPSDADFTGIGTKTGGSKTVTLTPGNMNPDGMQVNLGFVYPGYKTYSQPGFSGSVPNSVHYLIDNNATPNSGEANRLVYKNTNSVVVPVTIINPYRIVQFIEFVGVQ